MKWVKKAVSYLLAEKVCHLAAGFKFVGDNFITIATTYALRWLLASAMATALRNSIHDRIIDLLENSTLKIKTGL
ncbi:hypothetical protein ASE74_05220 [Pedobacter sp. Leaf216]|nr:hypothetical protein ASE74_05220 [Pedobacter sp. Leaf216]